MSCYAGSGTGVSVWELHIVERSADGALTGYTLPPAVRWETLSPLLRMEENGGRWYAMLGRELVDITDKLPEGLRCRRDCGAATTSTLPRRTGPWR